MFILLCKSVVSVKVRFDGPVRGLSCKSRVSSRIFMALKGDCPPRPTYLRSLFRRMSDSKLKLGGVVGTTCSATTTRRRKDTVIVESAAISLARTGDLGVVVKTTK